MRFNRKVRGDYLKKLVIGGFPCTKFSIAQKNDRVTDLGFTAQEFITFRNTTQNWWEHIADFELQIGLKIEQLANNDGYNHFNAESYKFDIGVHLFLNCLVVLDRQEYDYYMFENVSSMQKAVKETISEIMNTLYDGRMTEINSALVSAQNRKRVYWTNFDVTQPEDRGILLKDILESGFDLTTNDKTWALTSSYRFGVPPHNPIERHQRNLIAEPIGTTQDGKSFVLTAYYSTGQNAPNTITKHKGTMVAEQVPSKLININPSGNGMNGTVYNIDAKSPCLTTNKGEGNKILEPVCLRYERTEEGKQVRKDYENGIVKHGFNKMRNLHPRKDDKTNTVTTVTKDNQIAEPVCVSSRGRYVSGNRHTKCEGGTKQFYEVRGTQTNSLTTVQKDNMVAEPINVTIEEKSKTLLSRYFKNSTINCLREDFGGDSMVAEPIRVGDLPNDKGEISGSQATRIYSTEGKSVNLIANGGGQGAKTGLYAIRVGNLPRADGVVTGSQEQRIYHIDRKSISLVSTAARVGGLYAIPTAFNEDTPTKAISLADGKTYDVYEVTGGQITIKERTYPIKLQDGFYIIRKLTVVECCRLQTLSDDYFKDSEGNKLISDSQSYKCCGNGWTKEVIKHIFTCGFGELDRSEKLQVTALYDGISTGMDTLVDMGFHAIIYKAYEIDKYATIVSKYNFPSIEHMGDAFSVRDEEV